MLSTVALCSKRSRIASTKTSTKKRNGLIVKLIIQSVTAKTEDFKTTSSLSNGIIQILCQDVFEYDHILAERSGEFETPHRYPIFFSYQSRKQGDIGFNEAVRFQNGRFARSIVPTRNAVSSVSATGRTRNTPRRLTTHRSDSASTGAGLYPLNWRRQCRLTAATAYWKDKAIGLTRMKFGRSMKSHFCCEYSTAQ